MEEKNLDKELKDTVNKIISIEYEIKSLKEDIKNVKNDFKSSGGEIKFLNKVIKKLKDDAKKLKVNDTDEDMLDNLVEDLKQEDIFNIICQIV